MGEYLKMDSISGTFKKRINLIIIFLFSLFSILPVLASDNVISSVVISKSKDNPKAYELSIDSSQAVQYKTNVENSNSVYFDLKNSTTAPNVGTVYDDVSDIDSVVLQQIDKNKVRIYVKGKGVDNTELVFINSLFDTKQESKAKKIIINKPIKEYQSTSYKEDLENQEEIQDWDDNSFNIVHLLGEIFTNLKEGVSGIVLIILSLIAILAILTKALAKKISQDSESLIGLHNPRQTSNINPSSMYTGEDLENISKRSETIKNAQQQLAIAHQKYQSYLQNKYKDNYKPKTQALDMDAIKKSIAINQYQKSTQNPYKNQEVIKIKEDFSQKPQNGNYQIPPRPKKIKQSEFTSPYIQRKNNKIAQNLTNVEKKNNMKFLESVTKIYEQSGRGDLADGLKNSISKAKQSI